MSAPRFKALYSLQDLSEITGMSKAAMLRLLRRNGVLLIPREPKRGEKIRVSIASLAAALPDFAEGIRIQGLMSKPNRRCSN